MFDPHPDCILCPLHQSAKHPGIPTKTFYVSLGYNERAILFVGQSPGYQEDRVGTSFVGYTGQLLEKMIGAAKLKDYADIYLANACRCKPPQEADESQSQIRTCRPYLVEDVGKLQSAYKEVIIVALGAKAVYATLHRSSLGDALKHQGERSPCLCGGNSAPRVFVTYHPAILSPGREPGKVIVVEMHFSLILRYLRGEFIPNQLVITPELGIESPQKLPLRVTVDIETYGILAGREQTVFHPVKSREIDGIPPGDQIVTVAFGWRDEEDVVRTAQYVWKNSAHRHKIRTWLQRISEQKVTLVGQNIKFDLLYLRLSGDAEIPYWIDQRRLTLDDTMLASFLLYEQQPEKGLKELSALFGIADYSTSNVTGASGNAKSPWDPKLHEYNCLDAAVTLVLYEELWRRIVEKYGADSPKMSSDCNWTRNAILWDTFNLEKAGSSLRVSEIRRFHQKLDFRCHTMLKKADSVYQLTIHGTGSDKSLREFMLRCIAQSGLLNDERVEWTGKTKKISLGAENVNLMMEHLPKGSNRDAMKMLHNYKSLSKMMSTYTEPLLTDSRRGFVTREEDVGMIYPSWYPIPMYTERGSDVDSSVGGQIQGRFSCKKPARQTEPKNIRKRSCSRWPGGHIVEYDVNQDHLRMAALLSGDPVLMRAYTEKGISLHKLTAQSIFPGREIVKGSDEYALGKTLNFLMLFRGGPKAFQSTALHDAGVEIDMDFCARSIRTWYGVHSVYKEWQERMIYLAAKQGYLTLPTGWSRTFGVGDRNVEGQEGEICNFLHQTPCAQLLHSAQFKAQEAFLEKRLRSVFCLQIHDALFVDVWPGEGKIVDKIMDEAMKRPPLLEVFSRWAGRTVPWNYERKEQ